MRKQSPLPVPSVLVYSTCAMEVYIIRHGQSANNALDDPATREKDPPLTELGHRQAEVVARHLARALIPDPDITDPEAGLVTQRQEIGYGITRLYSSPMLRALQTALPIGRELGLAPEVWVDTHEQGGIYLDENAAKIGYPGGARAELQAMFPHYILPDDLTEQGWWAGGYEDYAACYLRAQRVAARLREWAAGVNNRERVALITHGTFTRVLLYVFMEQPLNHACYFWQYNTGIARLDLGAAGPVIVRYLNRIHHLTPELVS